MEPQDHASIRAQLDRIAESDSFRSSPLLSKFLRFTVEQTLAGQTDALKESVIGVEVCGRTKFDPRYDSVVRTTASRLRGKLAEYYEANPPGNGLRIDYPRGSYVPQFAPPPPPLAVATENVPLKPTRDWRLFALAGFLFGAVLVGISWLLFSKPAEPLATRRFHLAPPAGTKPAFLSSAGPSRISPDGKFIAVPLRDGDTPYHGVWIHNLESAEWRRVTPEGRQSSNPFWSPDSREVGYSTYSEIRKVNVDGSNPRSIAAWTGGIGSAAWSETGQILFSSRPELGLMQVPATGGKPSRVTRRETPKEAWHYWPVFLPGGEEFLYTAVGSERTQSTVFASSLSKPGERKLVLTAASGVSYYPAQGRRGGYVVYQGTNSLMAIRYDQAGRKTQGEPSVIAPSVATDIWRGSADASVSNDGTLVSRHGSGIQLRKLMLLEPQGSVVKSSKDDGLYRFPALSPDASAVAVSNTDLRTGTESIWILDRDLSNPRKFSTGNQSEFAPVWSPDGKQIAFIRGTNIHIAPASGIGTVRSLTNTTTSKTTTGWAPDGKHVIFTEYIDDRHQDIHSIGLEAGAQTQVLVTSPANDSDGQISPDGKFLLYDSDINGGRHIFIEPYPLNPQHREPVQLSVTEGYTPRWSQNGREVLYAGSNNKFLLAIGVASRTSSRRYETPIFFHRGYGFDCHARGPGTCVVSGPAVDPVMESPIVTLHPPWPGAKGR